MGRPPWDPEGHTTLVRGYQEQVLASLELGSSQGPLPRPPPLDSGPICASASACNGAYADFRADRFAFAPACYLWNAFEQLIFGQLKEPSHASLSCAVRMRRPAQGKLLASFLRSPALLVVTDYAVGF